MTESIRTTRIKGEMIVRNLQPNLVVEGRRFIAVIKTLDQCYQIPSQKKLVEGTIHEKFVACKAKVMATLQQANLGILTSDMWTSSSTEEYRTVLSFYCHS